MLSKAVFFDRDGVLLEPVMRGERVCGPNRLSEFKVNPQAPAAAARLAAQGFLIFIVTNQPDIARGLMTLELVQVMNRQLVEALGGPSVVQDVSLCPHDNHHQCACRKPKPGMILELAKKWPVDMQRAFMVGDRNVDIQAGQRAGLKSILLVTSYNQGTSADYLAADLADAARWINAQN